MADTYTLADLLQGRSPNALGRINSVTYDPNASLDHWIPPFGAAMPQSEAEREALSWRQALPYMAWLPPVGAYLGGQRIGRCLAGGRPHRRGGWRGGGWVVRVAACGHARCTEGTRTSATTKRALAARIHEPVAPGALSACCPSAGTAGGSAMGKRRCGRRSMGQDQPGLQRIHVSRPRAGAQDTAGAHDRPQAAGASRLRCRCRGGWRQLCGGYALPRRALADGIMAQLGWWLERRTAASVVAEAATRRATPSA